MFISSTARDSVTINQRNAVVAGSRDEVRVGSILNSGRTRGVGEVVVVAGSALWCGILQHLVVFIEAVIDGRSDSCNATFARCTSVALLFAQLGEPGRFACAERCPSITAVGAFLIPYYLPFHRLLSVSIKIYATALHRIAGCLCSCIVHHRGIGHGKPVYPRGLLLRQGVSLRCAGLPCAGEVGSDRRCSAVVKVDLYAHACKRLRNHVESEIITIIAHDDLVNGLRSAHIERTVATKGERGGSAEIAPRSPRAVGFRGERVASLALRVDDLHFRYCLVP